MDEWLVISVDTTSTGTTELFIEAYTEAEVSTRAYLPLTIKVLAPLLDLGPIINLDPFFESESGEDKVLLDLTDGETEMVYSLPSFDDSPGEILLLELTGLQPFMRYDKEANRIVISGVRKEDIGEYMV